MYVSGNNIVKAIVLIMCKFMQNKLKVPVYAVVKEQLNIVYMEMSYKSPPPNLFHAINYYIGPHCQQQVQNYLERFY
jgi:uncharacterized membrane protein